MRAVLACLMLVFIVSKPAAAQLPHNIPDLCANSGAGVPPNATETWTGTRSMGCVAVRGTLILAGALTADTIMVYEGGFLDVQSGASIIIRNTPLNPVVDPEQWAQGLIVFGRLRMLGTPKTSFLRLAAETVAGQSTLTLATAPTGWSVGDQVFLPDSRALAEADWFNPSLVYQHETRTITAIAGASVTLNAPLTYDHRGARDADGMPTVLADGTKIVPHVANLTRDITVRSMNPSGVRGHLVATQRADVEIRSVAIQDMGRTKAIPLDSHPGPATNQIGRYPLHIHHLMGPVNPTNTGYQFQLVNNVVRDSEKWPIAIHGSHYGLIEDNVIVGGERLTGAGLALEDGSETENIIRHNFIADIRGRINARLGSPDTANGTTPGSGGECLWGAGWNNRYLDNVMAGCRNDVQQVAAGAGVKFVTLSYAFTVKNPLVRGADMNDPAQTRTVSIKDQPILQFDRNEVYGLAATGLTTWLVGTDGYAVNATQPESLVRDFRVWHTYDGAIWAYPANRLTLERLTYRVDPTQPVTAAAITAGDYRVVNFTLRDSSIHASSVFGHVLDPLGVFTFERIEAVTRGTAFSFETPATPGTRASRPASGVTMVLRGNVIKAWPGQPLQVIGFHHDTSRGNSNTSGPYDVFVYDHQGVAGQNFRGYFREQANQDLYGGHAPCNNTGARADVDGITCPMTGTPPSLPPAPPPPPPEPGPPPGPPPGLPPTPNPPPAHDGHEPYCIGLNCLPIDRMIRGPARAPDASTPKWTAGDYDGDAMADPTVFEASTGTWYTLTSRSGYAQAATSFGGAGDVPVPGDYDGDGRTDAALYRPSDGAWLVAESRSGFTTVRSYSFGESANDVAVPADYDGDRLTDPAVFRPSSGTWRIRYSRSGFADVSEYRWGVDGDLAAPGDFDGDGRTDPTVYRPSTRTWNVLTSTTGFRLALEYRFGDEGDVPVPADYDGDGQSDLATYSRVSGVWRVLTSSSGFVQALVQTLGTNGDVAVPADYDGDGKADFAVYRPATGGWIVNVSPYLLTMPPRTLSLH